MTEYLNQRKQMSPLKVSVIGCLLGGVAFAGQANKQATLQMFQTQYDKLTLAYLKKDVETASALIAPDYSSGDYTHLFDKKMTLAGIKNYKGAFRTTRRQVVSVVLNGRKATVIADNTTEGDMKDSKGDHKYQISSRTMDTWVHNAVWQIKHSRVIKKAVIKDGKPILNGQFGG